MNNERPADVIVEAIKENIILRDELARELSEAKARVVDLEAKLDGRDSRSKLLETNLKRALIQEIEAESGEHVQAA